MVAGSGVTVQPFSRQYRLVEATVQRTSDVDEPTVTHTTYDQLHHAIDGDDVFLKAPTSGRHFPITDGPIARDVVAIPNDRAVPIPEQAIAHLGSVPFLLYRSQDDDPLAAYREAWSETTS